MYTQPVAPDSNRKRALIVVADAHGNTMRVAQALGNHLRQRGQLVDVGDALATVMPAPTDYEAVILGTELGQARDRRVIGDYITRHRDKLGAVATGLFVLSPARTGVESRRHIDAFVRTVRWNPDFAATLSCRNSEPLRTLVRRALVAMLRRLAGSNDGINADEVTELADAINREVRRAR